MNLLTNSPEFAGGINNRINYMNVETGFGSLPAGPVWIVKAVIVIIVSVITAFMIKIIYANRHIFGRMVIKRYTTQIDSVQ